MNAHTPGPWWNDVHCVRTVESDEIFPKGKKLATIHAGPINKIQADSNGALMAAAPDLLAACKAVFDAKAAIEGNDLLIVVTPEIHRLLRDAIARAEGRTP